MKCLIDQLHKQKDTPEYEDHCGHPDGSYIGSIQWQNHNHDDEWLDIYIYEDRVDKTSICIRFGKEDFEYMSHGSIQNIICSQSEDSKLALHVMEKKGKITFVRND